MTFNRPLTITFPKLSTENNGSLLGDAVVWKFTLPTRSTLPVPLAAKIKF